MLRTSGVMLASKEQMLIWTEGWDEGVVEMSLGEKSVLTISG